MSKYLVQADGASRGNPGPASYGAVVLSPDGTLIAELYESIGIATNNQAEYRAIIAALYALAELEGNTAESTEVHIQMDSKLVIEQLAGRWKIKNLELAKLASQAQSLMRQFKVSLEWIPREENTQADALANHALDSGLISTSGLQANRSSTVGEAALELNPRLSDVQPKSIRAPRQSSPPTTIWVIRHGHTARTESGLVSGGGDDPELSEFGIAEASRVGDEILRLARLTGTTAPEVIWHSPQKRAKQTALEIATALELPLVELPDLREIEFGDWEGISMESVDPNMLAEFEAWRGSMTASPPGGESVEELERRVSRVLGDALQQGKSIALVAHMMPVRAIFKLAAGAHAAAHWGVNFLPASISLYRFFGRDFAETFVVNSTSHLVPLARGD